MGDCYSTRLGIKFCLNAFKYSSEAQGRLVENRSELSEPLSFRKENWVDELIMCYRLEMRSYIRYLAHHSLNQ